jgi:hypothetical protein
VSGYAWSAVLDECVKVFTCDMKKYTDLTKATGVLVCACIRNFRWNLKTLGCEIDCSRIKGVDLNVTNNETDSCICRSPSFFNATSKLCVLNCSNIPFTNTNTAKTLAAVTCLCLHKYFWNPLTLSCDLNCSLVPNADPTSNPTPITCLCVQGSFWNTTDSLCWLNCTAIPFSKSQANPTTCSCLTKNFLWNSTLKTCIINCSSVLYSIPATAAEGTCVCESGFVWDGNLFKCLIDCGAVYGAQPNSTRVRENVCRCLKDFRWWRGIWPVCRGVRGLGIPMGRRQPRRGRASVMRGSSGGRCQCRRDVLWLD